MFQSFTTTVRPEQGPPRLAGLRRALDEAGLDGYLVPRADVHQGEYVAPADERLAWLTGFSGSAGFAAVLADVAGVFVDGRYRVQVKAEVDTDHFTPVPWPETKLGDWLAERLPDGGRVGYDPWLHTAEEIAEIESRLDGTGVTLQASPNLIDRIWTDRPAPPRGPVAVHPLERAGESAADKRARLAEGLRTAGETAAVLTAPDSIAWLLNIRGADVAHTPVVHAFAVLHADAGLTLFITEAKLDEAVREHLGEAVTIRPPEALPEALGALSGRVRVDRATAPVAVARALEATGATVAWGRDPAVLPKARKNDAEIDGAIAAHLRDGAAMAGFLAWLDAEAPSGTLSERRVVEALEGYRRETGALADIAFDTIAGAGPHAALPHYHVTAESDRAVAPGELLLVDSGGQYRDGTTDVTRTVAVGTPGGEECAAFTRVLRGMIAVSRLRWPEGLAGRDLEAVARYPLWLAGQDFDHGTGHGVGSYLSVHEGPQRLSRRSEVALEPGMILSNEPGYYREGAFGIRIENLVAVDRAPKLATGDDRSMLAFRTLTFVPIDRRLIVTDMLTDEEWRWLDAYHAEVHARIRPRIEGAVAAWLDAACAPL